MIWNSRAAVAASAALLMVSATAGLSPAIATPPPPPNDKAFAARNVSDLGSLYVATANSKPVTSFTVTDPCELYIVTRVHNSSTDMTVEDSFDASMRDLTLTQGSPGMLRIQANANGIQGQINGGAGGWDRPYRYRIYRVDLGSRYRTAPGDTDAVILQSFNHMVDLCQH